MSFKGGGKGAGGEMERKKAEIKHIADNAQGMSGPLPYIKFTMSLVLHNVKKLNYAESNMGVKVKSESEQEELAILQA